MRGQKFDFRLPRRIFLISCASCKLLTPHLLHQRPLALRSLFPFILSSISFNISLLWSFLPYSPKMNGLPKRESPRPSSSGRNDHHHLTANHPSLQYSFLTPEETASRLRTDLSSGLADHQDYLHRRSIHGLNQLQDDAPEPLYLKFLNQFKESPLILLLLASAAVSVLMGNVDDAISITLVYSPKENCVNEEGDYDCSYWYELLGNMTD